MQHQPQQAVSRRALQLPLQPPMPARQLKLNTRSLFMDVMPRIIEDAIEAEIIEDQEGDQS